jgi:nucleoid DNA-binding protein
MAKKLAAITKPLTKSQTLAAIAETTGLTRKQVASVLDEVGSLINRHVKSGGAGHFTLPGLLKIKTIKKAATKARKGINPFTGLETTFKAKPARTVVKIQALKSLKDMVK